MVHNIKLNFIMKLIKIFDYSNFSWFFQTLNRLLSLCGKLGTLSDGCMAIVEANFESIYDYLSNQLKASEFCDLVG